MIEMKGTMISILLLITLVFTFSCQSTGKETVEEQPQEEPKVVLRYTGPDLFHSGGALTYIWARGTIYNEGEIDAYSIKVRITFYDKYDTVLDMGSDYLEKLDVGKSWQYEVLYPGPSIKLDEMGYAEIEVFGYAEEEEGVKITFD